MFLSVRMDAISPAATARTRKSLVDGSTRGGLAHPAIAAIVKKHISKLLTQQQ